MMAHFGEDSSSVDVYSCDICNRFSGTSSSNVLRHIGKQYIDGY